jgi:hypothetical protein
MWWWIDKFGRVEVERMSSTLIFFTHPGVIESIGLRIPLPGFQLCLCIAMNLWGK